MKTLLPLSCATRYRRRKGNPFNETVVLSYVDKGRVFYHDDDWNRMETNSAGFRRQFTPVIHDITDIVRLNRRAGQHFFDADTLRAFNGLLYAPVYVGSGVYFVHSTRCTWGEYPRVYHVEKFDPDTGGIATVDPDTNHFTTLARAETAARAAAKTGEIPEGNTDSIGNK